MSGWQFDPYSALIGAALAFALVGLGYGIRQPLFRGWQEVRATFLRSVEWATAGVEDRYREAVTAWAQQAHVLARMGPLEQLFLPPRLIPPPPHPDPAAEAPLTRIPIPLGTALSGHRRLLVTGPPGSGRSALLAYLALVHARGEAGSTLGLPTERLPLYLYLADRDGLPLDEEGRPDDLTLLVEAGTRAVGGPSAAKGTVRRQVQAGTALILVDGWDEMDRPGQERAAAWLAGLTDALPGNLWVVAVGPRGYAPLADAGFIPLRLEEWGRPQVEALLSRCASLLSPPEGSEEESPPSPQRLADILTKTLEEGASRFELALHAWLLLTAGERVEGRMDLLMQALDRLVASSPEEMWLPAAARAALGSMALKMQQEGRVAVAKAEVEEALEGALEAALPPPEERPSRPSRQVFRALTAPGGPLTLCGPGRYAFAHPLWRACLAARQAAPLSPEVLIERLDDPRWLPVLDFYAEVGQMASVVEAWLSEPDDLWRTRLRTAARWTAVAPHNAPWRNGVMALLARAFLKPSLPVGVRERLAEALARTGDPGVPVLLRQALQHPAASVRRTAARAMGVLGPRIDVPTLAEVLEDPDESVRTAAAFALGQVSTPAALRQLVGVLVGGEEMLRVEAARGLARAGEAGWEVLREAIDEEDFLTRRAAAYGLGEVKAGWARDLLERVAREDGQWIVRSAAASVLAEMETARPSPVGPPLAISEMGWLITWAAERGEGVGVGEAAFGPLLRVLEQGEPPFRRAAAQALGLVGRPEHAPALRRAMDDPDREVAQVASWALEELARRHDLFIQ